MDFLSLPRGGSLGKGRRVGSVAVLGTFLGIPSQAFEVGASVHQ